MESDGRVLLATAHSFIELYLSPETRKRQSDSTLIGQGSILNSRDDQPLVAAQSNQPRSPVPLILHQIPLMESAQVLVSSIKGEVKKKLNSNGRSFSCFAAQVIEQDLF